MVDLESLYWWSISEHLDDVSRKSQRAVIKSQFLETTIRELVRWTMGRNRRAESSHFFFSDATSVDLSQTISKYDRSLQLEIIQPSSLHIRLFFRWLRRFQICWTGTWYVSHHLTSIRWYFYTEKSSRESQACWRRVLQSSARAGLPWLYGEHPCWNPEWSWEMGICGWSP